MPSTIAVINIGQLVTLAGPARPRECRELSELGLITDAAIVIQDGKIEAVGKYSDLLPTIPKFAHVVDALGHCVTPGFVDAHTHLVFAGNRTAEFEQRVAGQTYQQIAENGGGILRTVRLTRAATEDELFAQARRHLSWMMRSGTTTMEAKSGYGLDRDTELRMLRVIARLAEEGFATVLPTLLAAHALPPEFSSHRAAYIRWVANDFIPEVAAARLAAFCDAFCDEHGFTIDETRTILEAASHHGMELRLHCEQFRSGSGAELAAAMRCRTADHLEVATRESLLALKAADVQPVLLPGSVFALGSSAYPAARLMIEFEMPIVLATDFNPGSSPIVSMPFILSLACLHMGLSPAEALTAATINAAWSLGLGRRVGSIEPGKQADFLIHEFDDYRELAYFIASPAHPRVFTSGIEINFA